MVSTNSKGVLAWHGQTSSRTSLIPWYNPSRMASLARPRNLQG